MAGRDMLGSLTSTTDRDRRAATMRLRKVLLEVAADNPRAMRLYRRAGFHVEGVLRAQLARPEGFVDLIIMAIFLD